MRLRQHVPFLESSLKRAARRLTLPSLCTRCRRYASSAAYPEEIAVLGGGISGLASAYFINKEFPKSRITVFEGGNELGGWVKGRRVGVPGGNALFEYGPRTLRPGVSALPTVQLIQDLGLVDNILYTQRSSPGAKNRYIYYPDRLNRLPSVGEPPQFTKILKLWQAGLLDGAPFTLFEPWRPQRPSHIRDESIGSFIARRADKRIANNIVSAVMHGIYAGDVWQLSARTLLAQAWMLEGMHGSVWRGMIKINQESPLPEQVALFHPYDVDMLKAMREDIRLDEKIVAGLEGCTMFTFKDGLQELVKGLQKKLEQTAQVEIKVDSPVQSLKIAKAGEQQIEVVTGSGPSEAKKSFDLVISSLPASTIPTTSSTPLAPPVTVMTVNLFFPNPDLLPVTGFGYLIPQSVPFEQNPERALGVIFDSDAITGQDTAFGTKLTVMLGGHWWNGWEHYPDQEEGLELARSVIRRHLNITDEPVASQVNLCKNCIPQYTVGYEDRLKKYAEELKDKYRGRVRVVGSQFHGVGVNDCIRGAWMVARGLRGTGWKERGTGLERVSDERQWVVGGLRQAMRKVEG